MQEFAVTVRIIDTGVATIQANSVEEAMQIANDQFYTSDIHYVEYNSTVEFECDNHFN